MPIESVKRPRVAPETAGMTNQAVIAEPAMPRYLQAKVSSRRCHTARIPAFCTVIVMAMAVVRFKHVQRSVFRFHRDYGMWCKCAIGKAHGDHGERCSFLWCCPKVNLEGAEHGEAPTGGKSAIEVLHAL